MYSYKMTIRYDGAKYKGWQRLGGNEKTIQGRLETVLSRILDKKTEITGASRTDAGVHARGQVAVFESTDAVDCLVVLKELNRYLPEDMVVDDLSECSDRFHPRYNSSGKIYTYQIWNGQKADPFERGYFTLVEDNLDINRMQAGAAHFLGAHDFTTFTTAKAKKKSMVREIQGIEIRREGSKVFVQIQGDGFLHNQVRRMVGVLIDIGTGARRPEEVPKLIAAKDRKKCGVTAPPQGLFLERVLFN